MKACIWWQLYGLMWKTLSDGSLCVYAKFASSIWFPFSWLSITLWSAPGNAGQDSADQNAAGGALWNSLSPYFTSFHRMIKYCLLSHCMPSAKQGFDLAWNRPHSTKLKKKKLFFFLLPNRLYSQLNHRQASLSYDTNNRGISVQICLSVSDLSN